MVKRVQVVVRGRVQNVGFRMFVLRAAEQLAVSGWVRNLSDGQVELEAEGAERAVEALISLVRSGPRMARIDHVLVTPRTPLGEDPPFFTMRS